ncbi:MAG: SAM-dependent methyltransferase [Clostridia bacterium]|nr:SAM-dependent methyltransferase [Clostridia bacterium]
MGYGKRIDTLCSLLAPASLFADVGCDHGYCTEYMLKNGFCERAIFSDISKGSLKKAENLLAAYVEAGIATAVLGGGFLGVPKVTDEVLIAGMGGGEIVAILSDQKYGFMPKRFVFQPMHDAPMLRNYILENGGYIERDFTFEDGKFYDVLVGGRVDEKHKTKAYSALEYEFGRENLKQRPEAFLKRTAKLLKATEKYLTVPTLQAQSREELEKRKTKLQEVLNGEAF